MERWHKLFPFPLEIVSTVPTIFVIIERRIVTLPFGNLGVTDKSLIKLFVGSTGYQLIFILLSNRLRLFLWLSLLFKNLFLHYTKDNSRSATVNNCDPTSREYFYTALQWTNISSV